MYPVCIYVKNTLKMAMDGGGVEEITFTTPKVQIAVKIALNLLPDKTI